MSEQIEPSSNLMRLLLDPRSRAERRKAKGGTKKRSTKIKRIRTAHFISYGARGGNYR